MLNIGNTPLVLQVYIATSSALSYTQPFGNSDSFINTEPCIVLVGVTVGNAFISFSKLVVVQLLAYTVFKLEHPLKTPSIVPSSPITLFKFIDVKEVQPWKTYHKPVSFIPQLDRFNSVNEAHPLNIADILSLVTFQLLTSRLIRLLQL